MTIILTPSYVVSCLPQPLGKNFKYKYFCLTVTLKIANNAGARDAIGTASIARSVAQRAGMAGLAWPKDLAGSRPRVGTTAGQIPDTGPEQSAMASFVEK